MLLPLDPLANTHARVMRPLYALTLKFNDACLDALLHEARRWIAGKYAPVWQGDLALDGSEQELKAEHVVQVDTQAPPDGRLFSLSLEHPDDQTHLRRWHTSITGATDGTRSECSVVISTRATGYGVIAPRPERIRTPFFVREVVENFEARIGEEPVALAPYLAEERKIEKLARLLTHRRRSLPVVVVAPEAESGVPLVDPKSLQRRLVGYARVFQITPAGSRTLSACVGKKRSCSDGDVRIYWPEFSSSDDPYAHELYPKRRVRQMEREGPSVADALFERFLSTAVARFDGGALYQQLRKSEERARQEAFERLRAELAEQDRLDKLAPEDRAAIEELLDEAQQNEERVRAENDALEQQVKEQSETIEQLRRDLDRAQANLRDVWIPSEEEIPPEQAPTLLLSQAAREVYDDHPDRQARFDRLLERMEDPAYRSGKAMRVSGGGFVAPRGNSDERLFFDLREGVVHVCELFPHHQDSLADRYNQLYREGVDRDDYVSFEPRASPPVQAE